MSLEHQDQVMQICEALYNKKAQNIVAIYVADKTIIASWFVICSGMSVPQVKALSEELESKAPALGLQLHRQEGYTAGRWVVQDYGEYLVHIFHPEERAYYNMERLWADDPDHYIDYSAMRDKEES